MNMLLSSFIFLLTHLIYLHHHIVPRGMSENSLLMELEPSVLQPVAVVLSQKLYALPVLSLLCFMMYFALKYYNL